MHGYKNRMVPEKGVVKPLINVLSDEISFYFEGGLSPKSKQNESRFWNFNEILRPRSSKTSVKTITPINLAFVATQFFSRFYCSFVW